MQHLISTAYILHPTVHLNFCLRSLYVYAALAYLRSWPISHLRSRACCLSLPVLPLKFDTVFVALVPKRT